MILIDRSKDVQRVFLTLDGVDYTPVLNIQHDETRSKHSLDLPDDTSPFPGRYNLYEISTEDLDELPKGYYTYRVFDVDNQEIESGKLLIIDQTAESPIPAITDENPILVYKS